MRVGIAGYGLAGRSFHAPLLKGCGFEVATVLTGNSTRARQAKEDFPLVKVVENFTDFLAQDLDLVVVATANSVHTEHALAAISAGVPVVVEKPMGRTVAETLRILDASDKSGVPVTAFYNRQWDCDMLTLKKVANNGLIGKVFRLDSRFERYRPQLNPSAWRETLSPEEGGGLLLDLQTHLLSTALDAFGPADLTYASIRKIRGDSEDDVVLNLRHQSGVDSYCSVSAISGSTGPRIRALGTEGALIIEELDPQEALLRAGNYPEGGIWQVPTSSKAYIQRGDQREEIQAVPGNYGQFYLEVAGALEGKNAMPVSRDQILAVASIIDKAREISVR
ncbi:MviM Predicted dehydrogenases and related proteins [Candidatus Nanopelagicaceae bacterium]